VPQRTGVLIGITGREAEATANGPDGIVVFLAHGVRVRLRRNLFTAFFLFSSCFYREPLKKEFRVGVAWAKDKWKKDTVDIFFFHPEYQVLMVLGRFCDPCACVL
jgi:hypothetical protein